MQANGAEMLRLACILMVDMGLRVCAPVHDAVLIEASLESIDEAVLQAKQSMATASLAVLPNLELRSDVKIVRYPERYMDPRGLDMWNLVMSLLNESQMS